MVEPAPYDLLTVALIALATIAGLRIPAALGPALVAAVVFVAANIVSITVANESVKQPIGVLAFYAGLTVYLLVSLFFFAALIHQSGGRLIATIWSGWLVAAVVVAGLALAAYFNVLPGGDFMIQNGRARGTFKDPNVFGPFLIPPALLAIERLGSASGLVRKGIALAMLLMFSLALIVAFSRGAWGNFVVSALVYAALRLMTLRTLRQFGAAFIGSALVLVFLGLALVSAMSNPQVSDMLAKRASFTQHYDTEAGGRFDTQRRSIDLILQKPLGIGPNRSQSEFGISPHNVYIKVFLEYGWIGGFAFIALVAILFAQSFNTAIAPGPWQIAGIVTFASLSGLLAESVIIDTLHWRHLFLLFGMSAGIAALNRQRAVAIRPVRNFRATRAALRNASAACRKSGPQDAG